MNNTYIYNEEVFYSKIIPLISLILCIPIFCINCIKKKKINYLNNLNESNNLNENKLDNNKHILIINKNNENDHDLPSYSELFKN